MTVLDECLKAARNQRFHRDELQDFATKMEAKLIKNDHKSDGELLPVAALLRKLELELEEFKLAFEFESPEDAMWELVDIANFCMLLHKRIKNV
jgi:hypothetical protein